MAGAIVGLHVFGADIGPEPLANLDNNYTAIVTAVNSLNSYSNYYVDSGAVNALVVTPAAGQTVTFTDGLLLEVSVGNTSTSTAPTLNVNALGAKTITDNFGGALAVGALVAASRYIFIYDGTNFRCLNPSLLSQRSLLLTRFKPASTSRNNTTTLTNDPDLTFVIPNAGTYGIVICLNVIGAAGGQGINCGVNFSGSFSPGASSVCPQTSASGFNITGAVNSSLFVIAPLSTSSATPTMSWIFGNILALGTGTLSFAWAQNVSSANNVSVLGGSYSTLTPLN